MSQEKIQKRKSLIEKGYQPYPYKFKRTAFSQDIREEKIKEDQKVSLAGRLMRMRSMGQAAFFNIKDPQGECQCYIKLKELSSESKEYFKHADIGDILGLEGYFFKTKKGEQTLRVENFKILCKSTEMLPEKYHGLENKELRYRHRHLDLISNPEIEKILLTRSKVIQKIREFMHQRSFVEVETPVLQPIYGGAMAVPFSTKHQALDATFYLKISPELYLKRLVVGGIEKVFEIGKNFRNEGMDRLHNPEFTMLEYYESYTDYEDQMQMFEKMVTQITKFILGKLKFSYQNKSIDFTPPWPRIRFCDAIKKWGGLDVQNMKSKNLAQKLKSMNIPVTSKETYGDLLALAFDNLVEDKILNPTFITDFPKDISPLTKNHRELEGFVERFEVMVSGMELANAYTELNDPVDQRERLEKQQRNQSEEAHPMDEDFLHAVGVGLPPLGGVGVGIDRLVMLLTNQSSIREVIWFPTKKLG